MKKFLALLLLLSGCVHSPRNSSQNLVSKPLEIYNSTLINRGLDLSSPLEKIAFGSCANQDEPQPLWKTISENKPDLFLFTGDNIYASRPEQQPIAEQYRKLDLIPEYRAVREKVPFMATWDDHDFGLRDGGSDYSGKENARRDFLNYWNYVRNSIPLEQGGVYHAKIIGPKKHAVQVIMLDTRYFRSPLKERPENIGKAFDYEPNLTGTLLGETQWEWLEYQLRQPANVRFLITSIQLIANDPKFEKWGNFPNERQRFFDLLRKTRAKNVVLLSGDRHTGSISKVDIKEYGPLFEVTASSINRANKHEDKDSHYLGPSYNQENFGLAKIDWKKKLIHLEIRSLKDEVVNSYVVKIK